MLGMLSFVNKLLEAWDRFPRMLSPLWAVLGIRTLILSY